MFRNLFRNLFKSKLLTPIPSRSSSEYHSRLYDSDEEYPSRALTPTSEILILGNPGLYMGPDVQDVPPTHARARTQEASFFTLPSTRYPGGEVRCSNDVQQKNKHKWIIALVAMLCVLVITLIVLHVLANNALSKSSFQLTMTSAVKNTNGLSTGMKIDYDTCRITGAIQMKLGGSISGSAQLGLVELSMMNNTISLGTFQHSRMSFGTPHTYLFDSCNQQPSCCTPQKRKIIATMIQKLQDSNNIDLYICSQPHVPVWISIVGISLRTIGNYRYCKPIVLPSLYNTTASITNPVLFRNNRFTSTLSILNPTLYDVIIPTVANRTIHAKPCLDCPYKPILQATIPSYRIFPNANITITISGTLLSPQARSILQVPTRVWIQ